MTEEAWSPQALQVCIVCNCVFCLAVLGGCAVAVFVFGANGWWFALAIFIGALWSCKGYRSPAQLQADAERDDTTTH